MSTKFPEPQAITDEKRPPIELKPVESSQIADAGYDEATQTMALRFKHGIGAIYHYPGVTKEKFEEFATSKSLGAFFGKNFKTLPFVKYAPEPKQEQPKAEEPKAEQGGTDVV